MADPVVTLLTSGTAAATVVSPTFTAQPSGTLLFLAVCADDYRVTTGSNRPESSGWTFMEGQQYNAGHYTWWKLANGSETTVSYAIPNAFRSVYAIIAATNIDGTSPFGTSSSNQDTGASVTSKATPSITPTTAIRWLVLASTGAPRFTGAGVVVSAWSNSYTEIADITGGSGTTENVGVAYLILDGGTATSTTATFTGVAQQASAMIGSFRVASGFNGATSGTIAIVSVATGAPTKLAPVGGSAPVVSVTTGAPAARLGVAGTVAVTSTASGTANTLEPTSGSTPIVAAVSGAPTTLAVAAGTIPIVSTASGAANLGGSLAASGSIAVTTASSGAASLRATAAGSTPVTTTLTGAVTTLEPTSGSAAITSTASGAVTTRAVAAGGIPVVSTTSGSVNIQSGGSLAASGTVTITTASSGATGQRHASTATVTVVSASAGTAGSRQAVTGTVAAVAAVSGTAGQRYAVTALVAIVSAASGTAGKTIPLAGVVVVVSTASGAPQEGGWVGPIIPRVLVGYLRSDGRFVSRLQDRGRFDAKVRND